MSKLALSSCYRLILHVMLSCKCKAWDGISVTVICECIFHPSDLLPEFIFVLFTGFHSQVKVV